MAAGQHALTPGPLDSTPAIPPSEPQAIPPDQGPRRRNGMAWLVLAIVAGLVGTLMWRLSTQPDPITQRDVDAAIAKALDQERERAAQAPSPASAAYAAIQPSMVTITVGAGAKNATGANPTASTLGAGVVIGQDGAVLTALHVIDGGAPIRLTFADGTQSTATITSKDAENDIAVLAPATLPSVVVPAVMGGQVEVGDPVYAVGNPFGLTFSLTVGAVSGLERTIKVSGGRELTRLIQFDAAVNPGSSGGPLLDRSARVVGVVTGLANPAEQAFFVGVGFAVPIATAAAAGGGGTK